MQVFAKLLMLIGACSVGVTSARADTDIKLHLPADCRLGVTCFLQQIPDVDLSSNARDTFGGKTTYDGHKGTDIRLRYFGDIGRNVPVVASADGTVLRLRDGVPDRLVRSQQDRARIRDHECGNGVILAHANGWETQYCHLKHGSIRVAQGQEVKAGDVLGSIGSSGLSEFAHVHISVTKNGRLVDPFSAVIVGNPLPSHLSAEHDLWIENAIFDAAWSPTQLLDLGLASGPVDHDRLAKERPAKATRDSRAYVGWVSLINLVKGDIVRLVLQTPDKRTTVRNQTEPLDRAKATYSLFAGRRGVPVPGDYTVSVEVIRNGVVALEREAVITVQ